MRFLLTRLAAVEAAARIRFRREILDCRRVVWKVHHKERNIFRMNYSQLSHSSCNSVRCSNVDDLMTLMLL